MLLHDQNTSDNKEDIAFIRVFCSGMAFCKKILSCQTFIAGAPDLIPLRFLMLLLLLQLTLPCGQLALAVSHPNTNAWLSLLHCLQAVAQLFETSLQIVRNTYSHQAVMATHGVASLGPTGASGQPAGTMHRHETQPSQPARINSKAYLIHVTSNYFRQFGAGARTSSSFKYSTSE